MYCLCWSNFEEFNHIKYHWTVRKSDQMMYQRCWKTLPDTATDADLDPPHTPFSLYQPMLFMDIIIIIIIVIIITLSSRPLKKLILIS